LAVDATRFQQHFFFLSTSFNYSAHKTNSVLWDLDVPHLWQECSF